MTGARWSDERGLAPVVGKALEAGIVLLYVALLAGALYGHAVPAYRTAAGDAVAERTVATAAQRVAGAVPAAGRDVDVRRTVSLPDAIEGEAYRVRVVDRTLVLDHGDSGVEARERLVFPRNVTAVRGEWTSDRPAVVRVVSRDGGLVVVLQGGER